MSLSWLLTNFTAAFLLPPFNLLIVGAAGWLLLKRRPKLGKSLLAFSLLGLWLLSTPLIAEKYLESLMPRPVPITGSEADAIVILGGGSIKNSLEYGGDTVKSFTLERLRYGAFLARRLGKPVLVTGGSPDGEHVPEGDLMRDVLQNEFRIPVRWVENRSRNTRENARLSAELLHRAGIKRIYLVSHAWHLARAIPEFQDAGFTVIPAGIGQKLPGEPEVFDFIPDAKALYNSYLASHEWLGILWYRIRN